jgi:hypothetical protein
MIETPSHLAAGPVRRLAPVAALAVIAAVASLALAYDQYSTDGSTGNCAACHGDFRDTTYTSKVDGQSWGNSLHNVHRNDMLASDCNTCHFSNRFPAYLGRSTGGNGLAAYSCAGCHGRSQDGTGTGTEGFGAGLRQLHWRAGQTLCVDCHDDANPANKSPVGENVLPPYYATPGTGHSIPTDPCNPAPTYTEDYAASTLGLDNDGDGTFDALDPQCTVVGATPGEVSRGGQPQLLVTAHNPVTRQMALSYGPACTTTDNTIYYGPLTAVSTYGYSGQQCAIGNTGAYTWTYPASPSAFFFLVVGRNGTNEGSYGKSSANVERPRYAANAVCPLPQDLAHRCD